MTLRRIAVIRLRGDHDIRRTVKDTLKMLRLYKKNNLSIISNTDTSVGMLKKIKDHVTWGELDHDTFKALLEKRARIVGNKKFSEDYIKEKLNSSVESFASDFMDFKKELKDIPGLKQFFRLSPPQKGFERKGIKVPYSLGGALGYRKEKINDLIKRMI